MAGSRVSLPMAHCALYSWWMVYEQEEKWLGVVAKSLAFLAMHRAELGNSDLIAKAEFLEGLGIPRADVALMLGTSANSLGVMFRRKKKGAKNSGRKKSGRKE
jgi:hypothetical protein